MKNILITGSTDGIGKLAAIKLAKKGHAIYVHGRNPEKLSSTIAEIRKLSKNDNVDGFLADFSDLDSVRKMAKEVKSKISKIDVLINNAGVFKSPVIDDDEGLDLRFVVNYMAPFLLTNKLLTLLKKGNEPRLINVSSAAQSALSYAAFRGTGIFSTSDAYAQSKLALTMWSSHLAKEEEGITVIAVNPGSMLNTKLVKEAYGSHWTPAQKGADILFELALSEKHKNTTGKYFNNDKGSYERAHSNAYDSAAISKLIEVTQELIG